MNLTVLYQILALITIIVTDIKGHGFQRDTKLISCCHEYYYLHCIFTKKHVPECIPTFDYATNKHQHGKIVTMRPGTTNCYVRIGLDDDPAHDITCTPAQEFYLPDQRTWSEACSLNIGNHLLGRWYQHLPITSITFHEEPCDIYVVEVDGPHAFFIGTNSVLAKNMIIPCATIGYAFPFGGGTGSGLASILLGGTVTCTLGCLVGGVAIGYIIKCCMREKEKNYDFVFDAPQIGVVFQEKNEIAPNGTITVPAENAQPSDAPVKTVDDILKGTIPGEKTYGPSNIFEKPGIYTPEDTKDDFKSLNPSNTKTKINPAGEEIIIGILPDGRTVIARPNSRDGRPTLEIQEHNGTKTKIRYGIKSHA